MNLVVAKKKKKPSAKPSSTRLSKRCRPPLMGFAHAWVAVSLSVAHAEVSPLAGCGGHEGRVGPNRAGDSVSQRGNTDQGSKNSAGFKKKIGFRTRFMGRLNFGTMIQTTSSGYRT
jgi:hypothetical protein